MFKFLSTFNLVCMRLFIIFRRSLITVIFFLYFILYIYFISYSSISAPLYMNIYPLISYVSLEVQKYPWFPITPCNSHNYFLKYFCHWHFTTITVSCSFHIVSCFDFIFISLDKVSLKSNCLMLQCGYHWFYFLVTYSTCFSSFTFQLENVETTSTLVQPFQCYMDSTKIFPANCLDLTLIFTKQSSLSLW